MGMFKSLGLSPAKRAGTATSKAFRRLFGRGPSAGEGEGAAPSGHLGPDDEQADSNSSENTRHNHVDNQHTKDRGNNHRDNNTTPVTDDNALSSRNSSSLLNIQAADSKDKSDPDFTSETMAAAQSTQQNQGKENRPPPQVDNVTHLLSSLSLGKDEVAPAAKPAPELEPVPAPAPVPAPIFSDPAVVAERAMHMKFTEDALDMVSGVRMRPSLPPLIH